MSSAEALGSRVAPLPPAAKAGAVRLLDLPDLGSKQQAPPQAAPNYGGGFSPLILDESREDPRERAARQAAAMVDEAKEQAQTIREQARQEGYEAGYAAGTEDGRAAGQARVEAACDNLGRALKVLDAAKVAILAVMESEIVALAQAVCDRILLAPGAVDPELVNRVVREAVLKVGETERMSVSLHPDDMELVREFRPRLLAEVAGLTRLDLRPDPSLRPGDCRADSISSHVDATLESRRERIYNLLTETLRQGERPDMNQALERGLAMMESAPPDLADLVPPPSQPDGEPTPPADQSAAQEEDW